MRNCKITYRHLRILILPVQKCVAPFKKKKKEEMCFACFHSQSQKTLPQKSRMLVLDSHSSHIGFTLEPCFALMSTEISSLSSCGHSQLADVKLARRSMIEHGFQGDRTTVSFYGPSSPQSS